MTKILKKIMLICCSFLFVFCLSIGGLFGLNTMSAKAATDITFNSIAWNNIEYAYEYGPTGTLLLYNGGVNAITDVDTNLTAELGDKITIDGTPISSMKLTVSILSTKCILNGLENGFLSIRTLFMKLVRLNTRGRAVKSQGTILLGIL